MGEWISAVAVARTVFAERKIGSDQLAAASASPLPLDKDAEEKRAAMVEQQFGKIAPGIVLYTTDVCSVISGSGLILPRAIGAW